MQVSVSRYRLTWLKRAKTISTKIYDVTILKLMIYNILSDFVDFRFIFIKTTLDK